VQTITLDAIDDDGSSPAPGVPVRAGRYFEIPIGADVQIRVRCRHPDGTSACVGYTVRLTAKRRPDPYDVAVLNVSGVAGTDGVAVLSVTRASTAQQAAGRYLYDCWASAPATPPALPAVVSQIIPPQSCALVAGTLLP
jgi:hypothetical protein